MEVLDNVEEILGELEEFDLNDGDSERDKMFEYVRDIPWAMEELLGIEDTLVKKLEPLVSKIKELEDREDSDDLNNKRQRIELILECKTARIESLEAKLRLKEKVLAYQEDVISELKIEERRLREERNSLMKRQIALEKAKEIKERKIMKVYPNDPCPCGSGVKYKKCCGKKN